MCCAASRHYASPSNDRWTAQRRPSRSAISPAGRFGGERPNPSATSPPTTTYPATTQTSHTRTKQWSTMACHDPRDYVLGQDLRVRILTAGWSNPRQNSTTTRNSVASWPVMKPTSCSRSIGMIGFSPSDLYLAGGSPDGGRNPNCAIPTETPLPIGPLWSTRVAEPVATPSWL
jgi:hypothetical protein